MYVPLYVCHLYVFVYEFKYMCILIRFFQKFFHKPIVIVMFLSFFFLSSTKLFNELCSISGVIYHNQTL
jgi:hypothetical protein